MLINCAAYEDGKKLADFPADRIGDYVGRPGSFVWVALRDPSAEELDRVHREFGLHHLAVEDASHGHQRPKIEEYGDSMFVVMQVVEQADDKPGAGEPGHGGEDGGDASGEKEGDLHVGEVAVFVGPDYIVSVRSRSKQDFMGVRERCEHEPQLLKQGPSFVLYALMDAIVDRYFPIIDLLETELESIEELIFVEGTARANIERLYALKRKAGVLRHAVAPLMEVVGNLYGSRTPGVCVNTQAYFRDVSDHLARISASIDTIRDTIGTAIAVNLSMVTIEDSDVTKRLAAWAAIFAIATFFVGIWGMNFEVMPELKWKYGYPVALAVMGATCSFVWWRFRRAGWL